MRVARVVAGRRSRQSRTSIRHTSSSPQEDEVHRINWKEYDMAMLGDVLVNGSPSHRRRNPCVTIPAQACSFKAVSRAPPRTNALVPSAPQVALDRVAAGTGEPGVSFRHRGHRASRLDAARGTDAFAWSRPVARSTTVGARYAPACARHSCVGDHFNNLADHDQRRFSTIPSPFPEPGVILSSLR